MQQYIIEIIKGERKGFLSHIIRFFLLVLSAIYYVIVELRYFFYKIKIIKSRKFLCPVICIGNITAGGTGKTPAVITIANMLAKEEKKIVVLSRGYKSETNNLSKYYEVRIVSEGNKILLSPEFAGDEPYLLAKNMNNVGVVVSKDRIKSGQVAVNKLNADLLILDDGFQHFKLQRDLDIVLIDCLDPFGYNHLLPRGFLREPLRNLRRADVLLLNRTNQIDEDKLMEIKSKLRNLNSKALLVESIQKVSELERVKGILDVKRENVEFLKGKNIVSVCSIGNPLSFERTLDSLEAKIVKKFRLPDHCRYTRKILENIFKEAGSNVIVTTEKDAVRMQDKISGLGEIFVLKINLEITKGYDKLSELIISRLKLR